MKIVEIIFTRNEGELLKQHILFQKKMGVDFFIVTDSGSSDNTIKILSKFKSMGWVEFISDNEIMAQKENMDRMAILAKNKHNADWIIVSDTDEFWYCPHRLNKFLNNIPDNINTLKVLRYQHFPTEQDSNRKKKIYQKFLYRENGRYNNFDTGVGDTRNDFARKKILFKPIAKDIDILLGNHSVHFAGRLVKEVDVSDIIIHEFPFRSYKQFKKKIIRAEEVFKKNDVFNKNKNIATHWRIWVNILKKGNLRDFYYKNIFFNKKRLKIALQNNTIILDSSLAKIS